MDTYTATIFTGQKEYKRKSGDDLEILYTWMLAEVQNKFGGFHGHIAHNKTGEIVRKFRTCAPE